MFNLWMKVLRKAINIKNSVLNKLTIKQHGIALGNNVKIYGKLFVQGLGNIVIKDNVTIRSRYSANPIGGQTFTSFFVKDNAELVIEKGVGISNTAICAFKYVHIGENCFIGGDCRIFDTDFHSIDYEKRISGFEDIKTAPVIIGKGCFIGAGTIILKGVSIGDYSVIGAGSVVTKNVPCKEVWAGNPARFVKRII
ncbi:acyltransferase [Clostridium sp. C8-1-8]|uniref:acyltransferase n=1 Tax=Clostridium sp. C8-1-8 TaxID=2698831 RepID=UPI00136C5183|nr:acyltransferase [Clostridium sp. C8-1-8]